jgi:hypothetical protein
MSQIKITSLVLGVLLSMAVLILSGCGDRNSQSNFDAQSGTHPAGWLPTGHMVAAQLNILSCTDCHGDDFTGGISKVACTQCHLGNQQEIHPLQWGQFAYALHGSFAKLNGTTSCANALCHGTNLDGVGGTGPSCTSCHLGGPTSAHPADWNTAADFSSGQLPLHAQFVGANGTSACRNVVCHGANLQGVFLSGPSCNECHSFILP